MLRLAPLCLVIALTAAPAFAQDSQEAVDREVQVARAAPELARELLSPYCPGRTLEGGPSPDALAVREEIRAALRAGEAPDSIRERIEARFGQAVVGMPESSLGKALPIVLLAAGAVALVLAARRLLP
jgi:cytochrome c-type biogenesis protein CcmH/NrfF